MIPVNDRNSVKTKWCRRQLQNDGPTVGGKTQHTPRLKHDFYQRERE